MLNAFFSSVSCNLIIQEAKNGSKGSFLLIVLKGLRLRVGMKNGFLLINHHLG
jgi:hypothetical protein